MTIEWIEISKNIIISGNGRFIIFPIKHLNGNWAIIDLAVDGENFGCDIEMCKYFVEGTIERIIEGTYKYKKRTIEMPNIFIE